MKFISTLVIISTAMTLCADFSIIKDSKPAAQIIFSAEPDSIVKKRVELFNSYLKQITGTELPLKNVSLNNSIEIRIKKDVPYNKHYEWDITFPAKNIMKITATRKSIFDALNQILEIGADARFLGVESSMFQFDPRKNISMPEKALKSPEGYTVYRSIYSLPAHSVELGVINDDSFKFSHGLPIFVFPQNKYSKGWPEEIMPVLKGKKLKRPKNMFAYWQPCYSNPATAKHAIANIFEYLEKHPGIQSISLGVNDCFGFCECLECEKTDTKSKKSIFSNDRAYKSQSYYTWVNRVASEVCKKYPDLRIGLLAYGGTVMPPDFKVHPNVIPMLTLDSICEVLDPKVKTKHKNVIEAWGNNVKEIGVWEYAWGNNFFIPRVNFKNQYEFLKYHYQNNGRAYFSERNMVDAIDGPKTYLSARLLKDINTDPEAVLEDWYIRFAGCNGAPYLKKVYALCEAYWTSAELKKSPIYQGRNYIYMAPKISHMFAVKPGFTSELVKNAAKAHELAQKSGEKKRTEIILRMMEHLVCIAAFSGYPFRSVVNGEFVAKKDVLDYLSFLNKNLPQLLLQWNKVRRYYLKPDLPEDLHDIYLRKKIFNPDCSAYITDGIVKILEYANDPDVKNQLKNIIKINGLPLQIKNTINVLLDISNSENYFTNHNFENQDNLMIRSSSPFEISEKTGEKGQKSLKIIPANFTDVANADDDFLKNIPTVTFSQKIKEPGIYAVSLKVFTPAKHSKVDLSLWRCKNGLNIDWDDLHQITLSAGKWTTLTQVRIVSKDTEKINIVLRMSSFEKNEPLYISDIRLIRLGDISSIPIVLPPARTYKTDTITLSGKSERGVIAGKKVIKNNNPQAFSIAHISFVWNEYHDDDRLEITMPAMQLPDAKSGKIGAIIYEWNDHKWKPLRNILWNRSLSKNKFDEIKFGIQAKHLSGSSRYLLIIFKMKNTEGIAFGDVQFTYSSGKKDRIEKTENVIRKTQYYPYSKLALRKGSVIGEIFGQKAVINKNPDSYPIAHCTFNATVNDCIEFTMNAAQLPDAASGKIGAVIYEWKNNTWKEKHNVLWNRSLPKDKFIPLKFSTSGEQLGNAGKFLLIIFKMKNTGGIAVSDVKMQYRSKNK